MWKLPTANPKCHVTYLQDVVWWKYYAEGAEKHPTGKARLQSANVFPQILNRQIPNIEKICKSFGEVDCICICM